jgi:hypothetical protein
VLDTHAVLLEADSLRGLKVGGNVLRSRSRLQVILNETGTSVEHRIWVVEGLFYMMNSEQFDSNVSVVDLKGSQRTGHKGLCDLLIYTHVDQSTALPTGGAQACKRHPHQYGCALHQVVG